MATYNHKGNVNFAIFLCLSKLLDVIVRVLNSKFYPNLATTLRGNYTKSKLAKIYGINPSTINEWIKKYDRKDLMNARVMIAPDSYRDRKMKSVA